MIIRGWNFAAAMARWMADGMPMRTVAEIDERVAICQACPELSDGVCRQCGCQCNERQRITNKLALKTERCPIGKWS